jgi:hypothetical protein
MSPIECMTAEELRVDETWWRIYEDSLPASEREPREAILLSISREVGMAFRVRRQGVTLGLATTHLLKDPAAVFLVYLAVARGERNLGVGGVLLQGAWESGAVRLRAQGLQPLGMVWEVDPPQLSAGDADARQRRIAFFQRNGGQLLERSYLQPPVDGIAAVPMKLMFRSAEGEGTPTAETVDALVRAIYFDKYEAINEIDRSIIEDLLSRRWDS